jgi:hypothetical protein
VFAVISQTIAHQRQGLDDFKFVSPSIQFDSPSLSESGGKDILAYELKFLLTEQQACEIRERVAGRLVADAHADPSRDFAYETTSLYCDTAQLDVFHRIGSFKRRKHRLRRYADASSVFLERKTKWGNRVKKRRTMLPEADLTLLATPLSAVDWPGHWFHQHLRRRHLLPVCTISYERIALVGQSAEGPLRLTLDRKLRGVVTNEWSVAKVDKGIPLLTGQVICEFKYQAFLPAMFKDIIQDMRLTPSSVSKYRTFLRTQGHVEDRSAIDA